MRILNINYNLNTNQKKIQRQPNKYPVNFGAAKPQLTQIIPGEFRTETAKKLYSKIQKYIQLICSSGNIQNVRIMTEDGHYFNEKTLDFFDTKGNILLSVTKNNENTHININRKYSDTSKGIILLDALFDKNGQMIKGRFPLDKLIFERTGANVRRMKRSDGTIFMPVKGNDREWDQLGGRLPSVSENTVQKTHRPLNFIEKDNTDGGAFELFIEFARLYTSILK